jgi:putative nucleotidyltransferase with HDIG domain
MSAIYRIRQFVSAAGSWLQREDTHIARRHLPPAAVDLYQAMPRHDRQHALKVFHCLQEREYTDPDLLAAALLHDVGKTAHPQGALSLWHRVIFVLMRAFWPGLLEKIGRNQPGSWRWPFFVQQHHAAIGAELARQAGCSPETAQLIRHHEDPSAAADSDQLRALVAADGMS